MGADEALIGKLRAELLDISQVILATVVLDQRGIISPCGLPIVNFPCKGIVDLRIEVDRPDRGQRHCIRRPISESR